MPKTKKSYQCDAEEDFKAMDDFRGDIAPNQLLQKLEAKFHILENLQGWYNDRTEAQQKEMESHFEDLSDDLCGADFFQGL